MPITNFCKSCGMPLVEGKLACGSNADGSINQEYCEFCFKNGVSMVKDMLPQQIIDRSTNIYVERFGWKNHENARKEAANSLRLVGDLSRRKKRLSFKVKLILLAVFIIINLLWRFLNR